MAQIARVLYVEDDDHNYMLVERGLAALTDIEVHRARTGPEGLDLCRQLCPVLVLVDVHLPGLDGLEMTRRLKAEPSLAGIPVVALTANVMRGERERALAAGCVDFLPKPFSLRTMRELVTRLLGR